MAAVGANGGGSSEARRRRIAERGSDRLALITGRIKSLPPEPAQSLAADVPQQEDEASRLSLPNYKSGTEPSQHPIIDETVQPLPPNSVESRTTSKEATSHGIEEEESPQIPSSSQSPAQDHQREQSRRNSLTAGQIGAAVAASENARMWCCVGAAILTILSYIGFPIMGFTIIKSVVISGPVYLLLITNISIVLAPLILRMRGAELGIGQTSSVPTFDGNAMVDQVGKALEVGLLLQKVFGALFMDFSIFTAVLVCGLSLVRSLGW